jgi:hypothetical protein
MTDAGPAPTTQRLDGDLFHADITEVVHTRLNERATMLVVEPVVDTNARDSPGRARVPSQQRVDCRFAATTRTDAPVQP